VSKPILCLDFDGVVHQYTSPWVGPEIIADDVTEGFFEWAEEAAQHFTLVIYSSRSKSEKAIEAMQFWLYEQRKKWRAQGGKHTVEAPLSFEFACEKPAAFLCIDDRAIQFDGDWSKLNPEILRSFKPWNAELRKAAQ
jgi:hypothetical protein